MASGRIQTNKRIRKQFQRGLQMLLDTFYDTILLYTQDIQVVNFSDISRGFVNVIIMYKDVEGRSVKLEAVGKIDKDYVQTLDFIWQAMKRAAQEAPSDYSGPFSPLTLPTHNDLLKILGDLETITVQYWLVNDMYNSYKLNHLTLCSEGLKTLQICSW